MLQLANLCQIVIAAGIFNVWVLRPGKETPYRPEGASNLEEEFRAYGFPDWVRKLTGAVKLTLAGLLVVGIWFPPIAAAAGAALGALMLVAILAHLRVGDPALKSLPAFLLLTLCAFVAYANGVG